MVGAGDEHGAAGACTSCTRKGFDVLTLLFPPQIKGVEESLTGIEAAYKWSCSLGSADLAFVLDSVRAKRQPTLSMSLTRTLGERLVGGSGLPPPPARADAKTLVGAGERPACDSGSRDGGVKPQACQLWSTLLPCCTL